MVSASTLSVQYLEWDLKSLLYKPCIYLKLGDISGIYGPLK